MNDVISCGRLAAEAQATLARLTPALKKIDVSRAAMAIALGPDLPKHKLNKMHAIAIELSDALTPECACREGCSYCCHQAVSVSLEEARRMARHLNRPYKRQPAMTPDSVKKDLAARAGFAGVPCPLLDAGGQCTVYPVRPLACASYFNLSQTPEICDVLGHPGHSVPVLNLDGLVCAHVIASGANFADVRDWFPPAPG